MTPPNTQKNCRKANTMDTTTDKDRFPSRKHPRMKHFDYASPNYYFITICTWNKECIFGNPNGLSQWGTIAEAVILEIGGHFCNVRVDTYVIMPNHVHMILVLEGVTAGVPQIIGQYKSSVTRKIHETAPQQKVWQTSFHDHVIRNQRDYERIWLYIESNPQNWSKDCFFEDI